MPNTELSELIYTSITPEPLGIADVSEILSTAHKHNNAQDITGLLCYDGRRFLQIIEGSKDHIDALYQSISNDRRHESVELLHENSIETRSFEKWDMAYESFTPAEDAQLDARMAAVNYKNLNETPTTQNGSIGARLFSLFMISEFGRVS